MPISQFLWVGKQVLGLIRSGAVYAVHIDHLTTPRAVVDGNGTALWRWGSETKPFGDSTAFVDPDGDAVEFGLNLRFPGQYHDEEGGQNYNYFRDYAPTNGQYLQSDPIGQRGGINIYAYVENNPVVYVDSFGLDRMSYDQVSDTVNKNNNSGMSPERIICLIWKESGFDPEAKNANSSATGLMQMTKPAVSDVGGNYAQMTDPSANVSAGTSYLKKRTKWAGGDEVKGMNGYGTGPGYSDNILKCEECLRKMKEKPQDCQDPQKCLDNIHR